MHQPSTLLGSWPFLGLDGVSEAVVGLGLCCVDPTQIDLKIPKRDGDSDGYKV